MKNLLLSILSIVAALGVSLQAAQHKKGSFNYADHELKDQELTKDIRSKVKKPWDIDQLPASEDLVSDHWQVFKYKNMILKAPLNDNLNISANDRAQLLRKRADALEDPKLGLKMDHFRASLIRNRANDLKSAQPVIHGSCQNINRVRNAHAIQEVINEKSADSYMGVAHKEILRLNPNGPFTDQNCVIVVEEVKGYAGYRSTLSLQDISILGDIVEKTGLNNVLEDDFIRRVSDNKLMFINTEDSSEGYEEQICTGLLAPYKRWKLHHTRRAQGRAHLMVDLSQKWKKGGMSKDEQKLCRQLSMDNRLSYMKHGILSVLEVPVTLCVLTGLFIRDRVYTRSDNKILNKCAQAMCEKTEAIRKNLELLSEEERTDKIRDIVIDVLKENCPKDQDSAVIDAFVSLVYADVFVIDDQEKKAAIDESTRVIKKAWGDEWSLWAKAKRLATKVISLGRTNKVTKADEESELTREEAVTAVA